MNLRTLIPRVFLKKRKPILVFYMNTNMISDKGLLRMHKAYQKAYPGYWTLFMHTTQGQTPRVDCVSIEGTDQDTFKELRKEVDKWIEDYSKAMKVAHPKRRKR